MSGHADTIRHALRESEFETDADYEAAVAALDALVAENQQQADRIKWLEGEEAGWRTGLLAQTERLGKAAAENQQLRDALERIAALNKHTERLGFAQGIARAAVAGTPGEDRRKELSGQLRTGNDASGPTGRAARTYTPAGTPSEDTE